METIVSLSVIPIAGLLLLAAIPRSIVNARPVAVSRLISTLIAFEMILAMGLSAGHLLGGAEPITANLLPAIWNGTTALTLHYDGASSLMLSMVAFVGLAVARFSIRYLDGEACQGNYFRWLAVSIGAVSMMTVAGNMLLFFAAWIMTSTGLHQLLLHYRHRQAAHRAAWTKFAISRLGDAFLLAAIVLIGRVFGTLDFATIFSAIQTDGFQAGEANLIPAIGWFLMLGAVTKSAQFPFHIWLPDTMETPTPVSALMHAGIINAGGFLMIRMSPIMTLVPEALLFLTGIGAVTACYAGIVMMTQPSVKRSLAYSTVAQMGFMMLQCGLGAFSAAMLHIVAHSLYKAHAFLTTGSVLQQTPARLSTPASPEPPKNATFGISLAIAMPVACVLTSLWLFGIDITQKPGGLLLGLVLSASLMLWLKRIAAAGDAAALGVGFAGTQALSLTYAASFKAVDMMLQPTVPVASPVSGSLLLTTVLLAAFTALVGLHLALANGRSERLAALRVHALNGFYAETVVRKVFFGLAKS